MSQNAKNIEKLSNISDDAEKKINNTSQAINTSIAVANTSREDSLKMSSQINEIIDDIADIDRLSTTNRKSVQEIDIDLKQLVSIAVSLHSAINEFKS